MYQPVLTGSAPPTPGGADNRENGANPLRGRRCDRPGPRTTPCHCPARRRVGRPSGGRGADESPPPSRKPEDLPVGVVVPVLRPRACGQVSPRLATGPFALPREAEAVSFARPGRKDCFHV